MERNRTMNKKIILLILAATFAVLPSGCGKREPDYDPQISKERMEYYESDLFAEYKTNHYKFRMPEYWKGKYAVESKLHREDFYEINSYNKDESGLLFSVLEYEDNSYKNDLKGKNYTYMCYDKRFDLNYIILIPDEAVYPEEFKEQYDALNNALSIIKATFKAEL